MSNEKRIIKSEIPIIKRKDGKVYVKKADDDFFCTHCNKRVSEESVLALINYLLRYNPALIDDYYRDDLCPNCFTQKYFKMSLIKLLSEHYLIADDGVIVSSDAKFECSKCSESVDEVDLMAFIDYLKDYQQKYLTKYIKCDMCPNCFASNVMKKELNNLFASETIAIALDSATSYLNIIEEYEDPLIESYQRNEDIYIGELFRDFFFKLGIDLDEVSEGEIHLTEKEARSIINEMENDLENEYLYNEDLFFGEVFESFLQDIGVNLETDNDIDEPNQVEYEKMHVDLSDDEIAPDDLIITQNKGFYLSNKHKGFGTFKTLDDALEKALRVQDDLKYWGNIYYVDLRGTMEQIVLKSSDQKVPVLTIAKEIINQLGGKNKLKAMIGFNGVYGVEKGKFFLQFSHKKSNNINKTKILLNDNDLYDLKFYNIMGSNVELISEKNNIYSDSLKKVFERETGLLLSL